MIVFAIALSMLLRGRRKVHLLFAAFSTNLAVWYVSQALYDLIRSPLYTRATEIFTVLLPQLGVHLFQAIVPLEEDEGILRYLPRIATLCGIPPLALVLSPYHEAPLTLGLVYFYVLGLIAVALASLWRRGQKSPSRSVRDRVRFLVVVGALATTFTLGDFLAYLGVYLPPIGAVLAVIFIFVLAESLARPRLADLYELTGRLLVSTALAFSLAGIFYGFITYLGRWGTMYLNAVLAGIVFLVLFEPLETEMEKRIHQFFFRERYDLETSVTELRRRLAHALELSEVLDTVLQGLERSRRITSCAVYIKDADGGGFDLARAIGAAPPKHIDALALRPVLDRLKTSVSLEEIARERDGFAARRTMPRETLAPMVTAASTLGALKESVILAIRGDNEELVGLVCVADDRVRDAFTPEEIVLLETVAAQIGVAIANSRVYSRMKERDRLAALGSMAAGLAHEVKNPLGAIKGAAQMLEELDGAQADANSREFVGIILEETNRLNRVVGSFLDYARPRVGTPVLLDINAAVRRTVQILESQYGEGVELDLDLGAELPPTKIDAEQFRQVLINLIQNAVQAMNGRGRVTITTSLRRSSRISWSQTPTSDRLPQKEGDEEIEVSVRDNGPGITQAVMKTLFVPFVTTKQQGTGLGLAISQSIVQTAGGSIEVQSQPGTGTRFTIILPAIREQVAPSSGAIAPAISAVAEPSS